VSQPAAVTDATFRQEVLESAAPVLVDFWAEWCQPCKMIAPILDQIGNEQGEGLRIAKLDVDNNPRTPNQYGVQGIPTLILFKDGAAVERIVGFTPKAALVNRLQKHLG
jgi:thioredoxin 1